MQSEYSNSNCLLDEPRPTSNQQQPAMNALDAMNALEELKGLNKEQMPEGAYEDASAHFVPSQLVGSEQSRLCATLCREAPVTRRKQYIKRLNTYQIYAKLVTL